MDKNAIKKYAVWARTELIARVKQKAAQLEIEDGKILDRNAETVNGVVLTPTEKAQRTALVDRINNKGYEQVMEEVAYTWFNRFCALRFMEVNNYLPTHIRVFTNEENEFKPQIIDEAIHLELDGLDMQKVYDFKENNDNEGLYKYLIITQCNALGKILPGMFERISDYTELLFPDNILREGSVVEQLVSSIPQEDWQDAVQIIGWLYQYYNTEKKDDVFAALKKNVKISKDNIPAATQLFTPDWIVRYMVENSVGRWYYDGMQGYLQDAPDISRMEELKSNWKYYLDEAEQTEEVQAELDKLRSEKCPDLDGFKVIDPCMGSGHILVYAFDVLMQIYKSCGWSERDAVKNIIEKNLYGLDIDDRAAQLAYFAVMMKARQYDRRFLTRGIEPNIYAISESNGIDDFVIQDFVNGNSAIEKNLTSVLTEMKDAKEYGSIINITPVNFELLYDRVDEFNDGVSMWRNRVLDELAPLITVAEMLSQKYDVVVTNPPYMGASGMDSELSKYIKDYYPDSKSDLFAVFIERCGQMTKKSEYCAMITQHSWMFLSSFENLRSKLQLKTIVNMAHLGARAFDEINGEVVQTTAFVKLNSHVKDYLGSYVRLVDIVGENEKKNVFLSGENRYIAKQSNFSKIPGSPVAYWVSNEIFDAFSNNKSLSEYAITRNGMKTGDNERFLRLWYEVANNDVNYSIREHSQTFNINSKWFPYNKGGEFRKWYGNNEYVVNWQNQGYEIFEMAKHDKRNVQDYPSELKFRSSGSWSLISSGSPAFRYKEYNLSDIAGMSFYGDKDKVLFLLGFCNTNIANNLLKILAPTINYQAGDIGRLPIIFSNENRVIEIVEENVVISKSDWDSFETSWDFKEHPLVRLSKDLWDATAVGASMSYYYGGHPQVSCPLELCYMLWQGECNERFKQLKANEEELNRIFIDIYGLQDELTPDVTDKDITVHRIYDTKDDVTESMKGSNYVRTKRDEIVSLISYAVGCMFGRYSLYQNGIYYAGGNWEEKYEYAITHADCNAEDIDDFPTTRYLPDEDNIIPICDDEYFEDDIVGKFIEFIETVFDKDKLEENLQFIADALGGNGKNARLVIRNYFLNDFYADHCKIYQKRPIYWLFDSGKKNGFKALVYMHRYREDTIARMRTDYVHEQQSRYRTAIEDMENKLLNAEGSERVKFSKALGKLKEQDEEIRIYEEKIHHLADQMIRIDLDDGVKKNYEIFKDVLAKIK
jgi:type II restriction/modification system DNA methylase subunit YeeA